MFREIAVGLIASHVIRYCSRALVRAAGRKCRRHLVARFVLQLLGNACIYTATFVQHT